MIARLTRADEKDLRALLASDPVGNLFAISVLEERGIASGQAAFYGLRNGSGLRAAVALVGKARLAIPCGGDKSDHKELGTALEGKILGAVGKRDLVDALWDRAGKVEPWLNHAHRLYQITAEEMGPWTAPNLRPAAAKDLPEVLHNAAAMQEEDLGKDPLTQDAEGFRNRVAARIEAGRIFVLEDAGEIVFQVALGAVCSVGGQLEGVYTNPVVRGLGFASQGLGQLCRTQLARLPRLTLTVNEANREAVALYRKLGFLPSAAFRMIRAE